MYSQYPFIRYLLKRTVLHIGAMTIVTILAYTHIVSTCVHLQIYVNIITQRTKQQNITQCKGTQKRAQLHQT